MPEILRPAREEYYTNIGYFIAVVVFILVALFLIIFVSAKYSFLHRMNQIQSESKIVISYQNL